MCRFIIYNPKPPKPFILKIVKQSILKGMRGGLLCVSSVNSLSEMDNRWFSESLEPLKLTTTELLEPQTYHHWAPGAPWTYCDYALCPGSQNLRWKAALLCSDSDACYSTPRLSWRNSGSQWYSGTWTCGEHAETCRKQDPENTAGTTHFFSHPFWPWTGRAQSEV